MILVSRRWLKIQCTSDPLFVHTILVLVDIIHKTRECGIVCCLCFNSKCVYVTAASRWGREVEHIWANIEKTNMSADGTCVPYN